VRAVRDHVGHVVADVLALPRHVVGGLDDPRRDLVVAVADALAEILRRVGDALAQFGGEPRRRTTTPGRRRRTFPSRGRSRTRSRGGQACRYSCCRVFMSWCSCQPLYARPHAARVPNGTGVAGVSGHPDRRSQGPAVSARHRGFFAGQSRPRCQVPAERGRFARRDHSGRVRRCSRT
jgi:hypothetical protein